MTKKDVAIVICSLVKTGGTPPLCMSVDGMMGHEADAFLNGLLTCYLLVEKGSWFSDGMDPYQVVFCTRHTAMYPGSGISLGL